MTHLDDGDQRPDGQHPPLPEDVQEHLAHGQREVGLEQRIDRNNCVRCANQENPTDTNSRAHSDQNRNWGCTRGARSLF